MLKIIAGSLLIIENISVLVYVQMRWISPYTNPASLLYHTEMYGIVWLARWVVYVVVACVVAFAVYCLIDGVKDLRSSK